MHTYYCKNCNNIIGELYVNDANNYFFNILDYCLYTESKNIDLICFLDCTFCKKFVGIICFNVCKNCFGENKIVGEKKLFNFFLKYKEIINYNYCKICNETKYRSQCWFFEELTFYK